MKCSLVVWYEVVKIKVRNDNYHARIQSVSEISDAGERVKVMRGPIDMVGPIRNF